MGDRRGLLAGLDGGLQALPRTMRIHGAGTEGAGTGSMRYHWRIDGESMENRWDLIRTAGIDGKNKMIRNGTKGKRDNRRMRFFHTEPV